MKPAAPPTLLEVLRTALPGLVARLEHPRLMALAQALEATRAADGAELVAALLRHADTLARTFEAPGAAADPRERYHRAAEAVLALRCAGGLAARPPLAPEGNHRLATCAIAVAQTAPTDRLAADALSALRVALTSLPAETRPRAVPEEVRLRLDRWCNAPETPVWTATEALGLLFMVAPASAPRTAEQLLTRAAGDRRTLIRRVFAIRELGRHADHLPLLLRLAERHDGSEWLRQTLVRALLDRPRSPTAAEADACLDRFLDPGFEPSPRVRATVAEARARAVTEDASGPDPSRTRRWLDDPDPLVRRVGLEALRRALLSAILHPAYPPKPGPRWQDLICLLRDRARRVDGEALTADTLEALLAYLSPTASTLVRTLTGGLEGTAEGRLAEIDTPVSDRATVGRALAVVSQDDLDLFCGRTRGRLQVRRGATSRMRLWRVLHEWQSLRADKRRDISHMVAPAARELWRAHSARIACRVPTFYAGERTAVGSEGQWGRHLPPPDDLIDLPILGGQPLEVFSSRGVTTVVPPARLWQRLCAHLRLSRSFARYCTLRNAAVAATSTTEQRHYAEALRDLGIRLTFEPWDVPSADPASLLVDRRAAQVIPTVLPGASLAMTFFSAESWRALSQSLGDAWASVSAPVGNDIGQLAIAVGAAGALLLCTSASSQWQVARDRRKIPLTISGWGTRGKSSLERLKTAMFSGYGYEVLSKTTGSFPSMVYAPPWATPIEIPLYRPGGRATIWEQRDVLHVAAGLGVQVFAWECMAVRPEYAETLQAHWMHDRVTTLTNTYPDHEDLQGPSAADVTRSLCRVVSRHGEVVTGEELMLPLVQAEADRRHASVRAMAPYAHELLPEDLMGLFPYAEHPRNVALLMELARALGLDPEVAVVTAAEHVLPDVGVLRRMRPVAVGRHRITFVNGMSANDAPSALANLERIPREPGQTFVVVANARRDRPARTEVFARLLVRDIRAPARVLTGDDADALRRRVLLEAELWAAELTARTAGEARQLLQAVLLVADLPDPAAHPGARALLEHLGDGSPDAAWLTRLRAFAVDLVASTLRIALPHPDAVISAVTEAVPAGDVLLFAVQNIGGVGRALVSTFAKAERDGADLSTRPVATGGRLRPLFAAILWQLRSALGLVLAPWRRHRAVRILRRFSARELSADETRLQMERLMAGEY